MKSASTGDANRKVGQDIAELVGTIGHELQRTKPEGIPRDREPRAESKAVARQRFDVGGNSGSSQSNKGSGTKERVDELKGWTLNRRSVEEKTRFRGQARARFAVFSANRDDISSTHVSNGGLKVTLNP